MTDARDRKTYKTVTIGTQTWMAQNLNYEYNERTARSYCYKDKADSCAKYGRLYTWAAAMDSAAQFSDAGKGCGCGETCSPSGTVRGVCPEGWHLPNDTEWNTLWTAVGRTSTAGTKLKSTSGWYNNGNGEDSYGFSVQPVGYLFYDGDYLDKGNIAFFWSSSEYGSAEASQWGFEYQYDSVRYGNTKRYWFSVRCLKD
ncbi:MAG: fibrobacter succinogenes major paralogous domain-containing protein [Fibrobacteraceae bacterium]|nr:fibrobacter succinogenes major paralogous domain-containing protein [Fibrobacteraceae bacterium]